MGQLIDHDRLGANKVFSEMACEWNNPFQGESNLPPWEPRALARSYPPSGGCRAGAGAVCLQPAAGLWGDDDGGIELSLPDEAMG